jgi:predicted MFS family arabinose efflux permease
MQARARLATRLAFLAAGFGIACWAPLVPFAKARLAIDDGTLGILLLCLGIGSVIAMPFTGVLSARFGARTVIVAGGIGMAVLLPLLAVAQTPIALGAVLLGFGASLGSLDVAMNIHAVDVEKATGRPLMSGFHALFSIGGFAGSGMMTILLTAHLTPLTGALFGSAITLGAIALAWPRLMKGGPVEKGPVFVMPHGILLVLALLAGITFLAEGAILDWSALLLTTSGIVAVANGGLGYMLFSIAMTVGRLLGDRIVARLGDHRVLFWGGLTAVAGFVVLLTVPVTAIALGGFLLIGLGASNVVPVLFRQAGAQTVMPAGLAIAAITTTGYAGILIGPAAIGFVAHLVGLSTAFWLLALLLLSVPAAARTVSARRAA